MDILAATDVTGSLLLTMFGIAILAGLIKGVVGFAMPMIFVTGLTFFVAPDLALACLILPTLVTNGYQVLREGPVAAAQSVRQHWMFIVIAVTVLVATTQWVPTLPQDTFYLILGALVTLFGLSLLFGWQPGPGAGRPLRVGLAGIAGFAGGVAGIFGPPTVAYLNTWPISRAESFRVQGAVYGLGAVGFGIGHYYSGLFTLPRMGLSALLVLPALIGIWIGFQISDRINAQSFRRATLVVLIVCGLNLIRRGLFA